MNGSSSTFKTAIRIGNLRGLGAGLLVTGLVLPLGTSSYYVDAAGRPVGVEDPGALPDGVERVRQWTFALEGFPTDTLAWLGLLALAWPAVATAILSWKSGTRWALLIRTLEPPLMVFTIALIEFLSTFFVARAGGAYLAFAGAAIYCIGALADDTRATRSWLRKTRLDANR